MNADFIVVNPQISVVITVLLIINLLLVALAWWNFKETRRLIRDATGVIQTFLNGEAAVKIAAALERERAADKVREEFIKHQHGSDGKVLP